VASLSQGRTAAAQCGLFTHKSVPVIFEPPCIISKDACRDWGSPLKSSVTLDGDLVAIRTGYLRDTNQKRFCWNHRFRWWWNKTVPNTVTCVCELLLHKSDSLSQFRVEITGVLRTHLLGTCCEWFHVARTNPCFVL